MRKLILLLVTGCISLFSFSQQIQSIINAGEVKRIESVLAADDMQGRGIYSAGIEKAAQFIAGEFRAAGLAYLPGQDSTYRQEFTMIRSKFISAEGSFNGKTIHSKQIIAFTSKPELKFGNGSGFEIETIAAGDELFEKAIRFTGENRNLVVLVDTSFEKNFGRLIRFKRDIPKKETSTVFILATPETAPALVIQTPEGNPDFTFTIRHEISENKLTNIAGIIPGKTKPHELVVFSAHYDHLGIGKPNAQGDSIYNGANDDAAGTTAVILLAKYFAALEQKPERTLVFVAFTAEESGGFGSRYFSKQVKPDSVIAMCNIEMIGTESKWGKKSAFITGYEKSNLGSILQNNLAGSPFRFEPDPYPDQQLFYRSDNATLAALGVPAHTISTSKMDSEKYYHTQEDEVETLDMDNMTEIIRAIALSMKSIINGKDTPSRVEKMK